MIYTLTFHSFTSVTPMVKRKRMSNGSGPPKKRGRFRKTTSSATTQRNLRTGGFLGVELKFYDNKLVDSALTAPTDASGGEQDPSATVMLNTVVQGDGESNRDGRQIMMKSISLNGVIEVPVQVNQTAGDVACVVFLALVMDKQTNGATINSEDVYTNKGANAAVAASPYRNLQQSQRFRVLRTLQITLPQPRLVWDGTNVEQSGFTIPWRMDAPLNISTLFKGTTETVANIVDNSLHLIGYCSDTGLAPQISYNSRLRFVG